MAGSGSVEVEVEVEVSSIVRLGDIDRRAADRLGTLVLATANTVRDPVRPLRVQTTYDDGRNRMSIVILGGAAATADLLRLLHDVLDGDGLFAGDARSRRPDKPEGVRGAVLLPPASAPSTSTPEHSKKIE